MLDAVCGFVVAGSLAPAVDASASRRVVAVDGRHGSDCQAVGPDGLVWAVLGFRRFYHLDDFRHPADLGLALFTGETRLLSDSAVWRLVHRLKPDRAEAFYRQAAAETVPSAVPEGEDWLSMDEHVVGFFTKRKPRPLGKTRVPTRGRSYPAIRLYTPFHLWAGRFMGLVVTQASVALSQVVPTLLSEVRRLRTLVGHPRPDRVVVLLDRGDTRVACSRS